MIDQLNKAFQENKVPLIAVEVEITYTQPLVIPKELKGKKIDKELRKAIQKLQTSDFISGKKSMLKELQKQGYANT